MESKIESITNVAGPVEGKKPSPTAQAAIADFVSAPWTDLNSRKVAISAKGGGPYEANELKSVVATTVKAPSAKFKGREYWGKALGAIGGLEEFDAHFKHPKELYKESGVVNDWVLRAVNFNGLSKHCLYPEAFFDELIERQSIISADHGTHIRGVANKVLSWEESHPRLWFALDPKLAAILCFLAASTTVCSIEVENESELQKEGTQWLSQFFKLKEKVLGKDGGVEQWGKTVETFVPWLFAYDIGSGSASAYERLIFEQGFHTFAGGPISRKSDLTFEKWQALQRKEKVDSPMDLHAMRMHRLALEMVGVSEKARFRALEIVLWRLRNELSGAYNRRTKIGPRLQLEALTWVNTTIKNIPQTELVAWLCDPKECAAGDATDYFHKWMKALVDEQQLSATSGMKFGRAANSFQTVYLVGKIFKDLLLDCLKQGGAVCRVEVQAHNKAEETLTRWVQRAREEIKEEPNAVHQTFKAFVIELERSLIESKLTDKAQAAPVKVQRI